MIDQKAIAKGERERSAKIDKCLDEDDIEGYWLNYRDYLLWCKETSRGYLSPMRQRLLNAIEKTMKRLEQS